MTDSELLEQNLKLVHYIARQPSCRAMIEQIMCQGGCSKDDVLQECALDVLKNTIPRWREGPQEHKLSTFIANGVKWRLRRWIAALKKPPRQFKRSFVRISVDEFDELVEVECDLLTPLEQEAVSKIVQNVIKQLDSRSRKILQMRFWKQQSLAEVGKKLHLSGPRIRTLQNKALLDLCLELREQYPQLVEQVKSETKKAVGSPQWTPPKPGSVLSR